MGGASSPKPPFAPAPPARVRPTSTLRRRSLDSAQTRWEHARRQRAVQRPVEVAWASDTLKGSERGMPPLSQPRDSGSGPRGARSKAFCRKERRDSRRLVDDRERLVRQRVGLIALAWHRLDSCRAGTPPAGGRPAPGRPPAGYSVIRSPRRRVPAQRRTPGTRWGSCCSGCDPRASAAGLRSAPG